MENSEVTVNDFISGNCLSEMANKVDDYVLRVVCERKHLLGVNPTYLIGSAIEDKYGITFENIIDFANERYCGIGDPAYTLAFLEALWVVFELPLGLSYQPNAVISAFPNLRFDKDQLLTGPSEYIDWRSDGVLIGHEHFVPFPSEVALYGLYDFWSRLLEVRTEQGISTKQFGIAVHPDLIMDQRRFYMPTLQKAYMRGPIGLSEADLLRSDFPADYEGTETEHRRVDCDALHVFDVDVLQILWSASTDKKTGIQVKSVEIEELVPINSSQFKFDCHVTNRYIHAEWDVDRCCFRHLDGGLRIYNKNDYSRRVCGSVKKAVDFQQVHKKLFRIDANLDVNTWSDLVALFFAGNELMVEYLGGADTEAR